MSTLFPITPPRIPPAAAPMMPPFTLSRLVVAPMIAPAAAPIAASRLVFFLVTVCGADAALPLPLLLPPVEARRAGVDVFVRRTGAAAAGAALARSPVAFAPFIRSAAEMESSRALGFAWAARERSLFSDGSAALSLLHAAESTIAGARMIAFMMERMVPPRDGALRR